MPKPATCMLKEVTVQITDYVCQLPKEFDP